MPDRPLCLHEVLIDEVRHIRGLTASQGVALEQAGLVTTAGGFPEQAPSDEQNALQQTYAILRPSELGMTALCLSGGGIRSASFALGVLQALAEKRVLERFDYLSTVSGGGYVGGFLTAWIHRAHQEPSGAGVGPSRLTGQSTPLPPGVQRVFGALAGRYQPKPPTAVEPDPIRHLRSYSRYLAPRGGLLSVDTWTLAAIYLRNLAITWSVVLPFVIGLMALPVAFTSGITAGNQALALPAGFAAMGLLLLVAGPALAAFRARLHREPSAEETAASGAAARLGVRRLVVYPMLVASAAAVFAIGVDLFTSTSTDLHAVWRGMDVLHPDGWKTEFIAFSALFGAMSGFMAFLMEEALNLWREEGWRRSWRRLRLSDLVVMPVAGAVGGAVGGLLLIGLSQFVTGMTASTALAWYATLAPAIGLVAVYVALAAYTALGNRLQGDFDREWLARISAQVLMAALGWSAWFAVALFGPVLITKGIPGLVETAGGVAGILVYVLTKVAPSANEPGRSDPRLLRLALPAAAIVLMVCLLMMVARVTHALIPPIAEVLSQGPMMTAWAPLVLIAGSWLLAVLLSALINPNTFALHATYRLRIVRTWLGATRPSTSDGDRDFTGDDDLPLAKLWPPRPRTDADPPRPLFPVINAALNVIGGGPLGLQDRKALPFSFSPLHCGAHSAGMELGFRPSAAYGYDRGNQSGVTLGTAMAISGAAVSPSMGAFSSGVTAMVLALLNIRLGSWLGNPGSAGARTWRRPGPLFALNAWLSEAMGWARADSAYVYLSDGGHFENLGVYEMIRRRCRVIVVSDAGCDGEQSYADLATAVRLVRVDLGIPLEFAGQPFPPLDQPAPRLTRHRVLVATIRYAAVDGEQTPAGVLIYVKAGLTGEESVDLHNFARRFPAFPHQTTADQFFDEPQLESYRSLGHQTVTRLMDAPSASDDNDTSGTMAVNPDPLQELIRCARANQPPMREN